LFKHQLELMKINLWPAVYFLDSGVVLQSKLDLQGLR
jgi:hypothetical protein